MSEQTHTLTFTVDELDYLAIKDALAVKQVGLHPIGGPPEGADDLAGRLLGDIARDYVFSHPEFFGTVPTP